MARLHPNLPAAIKQLSEKEKEKIILRFARAQAEMAETLAFELLDDVTVESIEAETKEELQTLLFTLGGRSVYKGLNRALAKCMKLIQKQRKITKSTKLEIDLLHFVLHILFENYSGQFENKQRGFATRMVKLMLKLYNLIDSKLHPDYRLEYKDQVDVWLTILHIRAGYIANAHALPETLPE